jgi:putative membrane protein
MAGILAGVTALMVLSEADKEHGNGRTGGWRATLAALVVVMSAGAMGHVVLFDVGLVGPLFIGLFGVPVILIAMEGERGTTGGPATSTGSVPRRFPLFPVVTGSLMGCLVGWFPGVSSAQATILAVPRREGEPDDMDGARRFIAGVSAVNTANAVFVLVALTTLLRIRSGAAVAVNALMEWDQPPWPFGTSPGLDVAMLVLSAAVGGLIGAPVTMVVGRRFQRSLPLLSHRVTLGLLLLMLVGLSYVTSGPMALPVVAVAGALGMVPPKLGLMRVHLMGVVTVPLVLGLGLL